MIELTPKKDKSKWNSTIKKMMNHDFYFSNSYHSNNDGALLISFKEQGYNICLPLIIRHIENTNYFDATSVYGYSGPLRSESNIPDNIISKFNDELKICLSEMNVVTVFSRLHPLFKQEDLLSNIGDITPLGKTVSIDLTLSLKDQRCQYRKRLKSRINRFSKSTGFVYEDTKLEYVDDFIKLYHENMKRVNAESIYFFDKGYFNNLFFSDDIDAKLLFIKKDGVLISGAIFVYTDGIIQYHLSGTKFEYLKHSPLELLLDYVRITGTQQGYKNLHLGGGVGSKEDSLYHYKTGFSKVENNFKVWKYIVNEEIYNQLINEVEINEDDCYFPPYRIKAKQL